MARTSRWHALSLARGQTACRLTGMRAQCPPGQAIPAGPPLPRLLAPPECRRHPPVSRPGHSPAALRCAPWLLRSMTGSPTQPTHPAPGARRIAEASPGTGGTGKARPSGIRAPSWPALREPFHPAPGRLPARFRLLQRPRPVRALFQLARDSVRPEGDLPRTRQRPSPPVAVEAPSVEAPSPKASLPCVPGPPRSAGPQGFRLRPHPIRTRDNSHPSQPQAPFGGRPPAGQAAPVPESPGLRVNGSGVYPRGVVPVPALPRDAACDPPPEPRPASPPIPPPALSLTGSFIS
jgi:hypothetical protein